MTTLKCFPVKWVVTVMVLAGSLARAQDLSIMSGDFLRDNHVIEGVWVGGKNFKGNVCSRGFYSFRVKAKALLDQVEMNLESDNQLDIDGRLSNAYGRVEGDYLGDYSACQNVSGWLGVGVDTIRVRAKVTVPDDESPVKVRVYSLTLGRLHLGQYTPAWFENLVTDSLNRAIVYIWKTRLGDWLNQSISYYFNSLKDKKGL